MKSRVNWRTVRSSVVRMPCGVIFRSPVRVDVLDAELGRIIEVKVPVLRLEGAMVMIRGLMNFVRLLSGVSRQFTITGEA